MNLLNITFNYQSTDPKDMAGIFIHRQWQSLSQMGWDIKVINPQPLLYRRYKGRAQYYPQFSLQDNIPTYRPLFPYTMVLKSGKIYDKIYSTAVQRALASLDVGWEPDIIIADFIVPSGPAAVAVTKKKFDAPIVMRAHGIDVWTILDRIESEKYVEYYSDLFLNASCVTANGGGLYKNLYDTNLIEQDKLLDIPLGLRTDLFHPATHDEKIQLKQKFGWPIDRPIWIFVGNWIERKGVVELSKALEKLLPQFPDVYFVAVGSIIHKESHAILSQFPEQVNFVGPIEPTQVGDYLRAADVFVFPTRREGLPTALLEAMACGLLCITTPVNGIPYVINDRENGVFVKPENPDSVYQELFEQAKNPDRYAEIKQNAIDTITNNYTMDIIKQRLDTLFKQLIHDHKKI